MKFESTPKISEYKNSNNVVESLRTPEQLATKEYIFRDIIENKALDSFKEHMDNAGFEENQIAEFELMLASNPDMMPKILAFPYELKKRSFSHFQKQINEGKADLQFMFDTMVKRAKMINPKIAYHCSQQDIRSKMIKDTYGPVEVWNIDGTEKDHRDDDLPMAYYSFNYLHLYREKNPKYLYLIESNPKHRTDGADWGRAPGLSIIDRLDLKEVDKQVEERYQEYLQQEKEAKPEAA